MKSKQRIIWIVLGVGLLMVPVVYQMQKWNKKPEKRYEIVHPTFGSIQITVSTTGMIEPQNRLEIKAPLGGRVEQILVKEGEKVRAGQKLILMSSTERAALLDAAKAQGEETSNYWDSVYKTTPILSPLQGTVIVRQVEPGQTVTQGEVLLVLSDRLIVKAQVDETDISKVKLGQDATISLDAYPDIKVDAEVNHIAYESQVINNVTIYEVDILPRRVPPVFRSGMSANVEIILAQQRKALLLPREAVLESEEGNTVLVPNPAGAKPQEKKVEIGIANDTQIEILSGLSSQDEVLIEKMDQKQMQETQDQASPFMPRRPRGRH